MARSIAPGFFSLVAAEVKVKIINLPKQLAEEVRDSEESASSTMDKAKTLKEATVSLADSFSKLMNDLVRGSLLYCF